MAHAGHIVQINVEAGRAYQIIDGFGVNINSKYWNQGKLIPALNLLRADLGATLYRVDIFGKSNWPDPAGTLGPDALDPDRLAAIYRGDVARNGWAMIRYLNEHGIEPYLTVSGDVPRWMLGPDGRTLEDYERFCDMLVSLVAWARQHESLRITYFGPLNETDLGNPEGPFVTPDAFARVLLLLDEKLRQVGLDDIKLVVAEQAFFNTAYLEAIVEEPRLAQRIGVFGLHCYGTISPDQFAAVHEIASTSDFATTHLWMTEYGDLDQSGEKEWYVAWAMTERLFSLLEGGFQAALVWDAYDNYHDHDQDWTIYGLLRTGLRVHTPKLRYFAAKQIFRFVPPGFERIAAETESPGLRVLAFANPERTQITVVGMNRSSEPAYLNVALEGFPSDVMDGTVSYYRTSEHERCHTIGTIPVRGPHGSFKDIDAVVPPASMFTLTNLQQFKECLDGPQDQHHRRGQRGLLAEHGARPVPDAQPARQHGQLYGY